MPRLTPRTSLQADDEAVARVYLDPTEALAGDCLLQLGKAVFLCYVTEELLHVVEVGGRFVLYNLEIQ